MQRPPPPPPLQDNRITLSPCANTNALRAISDIGLQLDKYKQTDYCAFSLGRRRRRDITYVVACAMLSLSLHLSLLCFYMHAGAQ